MFRTKAGGPSWNESLSDPLQRRRRHVSSNSGYGQQVFTLR